MTSVTTRPFRKRLTARGTSAQRPTGLGADETVTFFDTDLGKLLTWNGARWIDGRGIAVDQLMFASTRAHLPTNSNTTTSANNFRACRTMHVSPDYPVLGMRVIFTNWYNNSSASPAPETDPGTALTIEGASIEINGVFTALTFGGQSSVTIADGGIAISDPVPGVIPAATKYFIRAADTVPAGQKRPAGGFTQARNGEGVVIAASSQLALVSGGTVSGTAGMMVPAAVVAQGWDGRDVVLITGDSIAFGQSDNLNAVGERGAAGFIERGLDSPAGGRIPYGQFACPASSPSQQGADAAGQYQRKMQLLRAIAALNPGGAWPFNKIVSEHGVNDSSNTLASITTAVTGFWTFLASMFPGVPIIQTTYPPRAAQLNTSLFTTLADQDPVTPNTEANALAGPRAGMSLAIRNRPAALIGVIDAGPYFADPANPYKWRVRPYASTLAAAAAAGATSVSIAAPPPAMDETIVFEPGDATNNDGALNYAVVGISGSGPYTVTLSQPLAKAHASSAVVKASSTQDNLHPSSAAHILAAQAIVDAKHGGLLRGRAA